MQSIDSQAWSIRKLIGSDPTLSCLMENLHPMEGTRSSLDSIIIENELLREVLPMRKRENFVATGE